ncbi:MAG: hypothetical protein ABJP02_13745 [Parasphingorhabdus sp.]|uniref:hypothetical protein n=1 Tax=Parasphingorhabdus sp. TaxID=2709688 RepID=UPI0032982CD7
MQRSKWAGLTLLGSILASPSVSASEPQAIEDNEPTVMRIIFDDCLSFVYKDVAPFEGLTLLPITAKGKDMLRARYAESGPVYHLFSDRYVVAWGEDSEDRYCILLTSRPSDRPMMLGVERAGFPERLSKRADAAGMTKNDMPGPFSPLHTMSWRAPDEDGRSGLRMVVMPTDGVEDQKMVDAGLIVVAAGVNSKED